MSAKKQNNNRLSFSLVVEAFNENNFRKASDLLKKAWITSEESGVAKQIKVEIANQQAIEFISQYNFSEAIKVLDQNFQLQPKQGFPLATNKSNILLGIAYLYIGNFNKTINLLSDANKSKATFELYFYYILAKLYNNEFSKLELLTEFQNIYKDYLSKLNKNKAIYLEAIFYLMKDDLTKFCDKIHEIISDNHTLSKNLELLNNFLQNKNTNSSTISVKPLYKLLNEAELSLSEITYLKKFPKISANIERKQNEDDDILIKEELEKLCLYGVQMSANSFVKCMNNDKFNEFHHLILFNQLNAIIQHKEEENELLYDFNLIIKLISSHRKLFFQVPESIYVYLLCTYDEEISQESFFNYISIYFESHKHHLSDIQIEYIGIEIYNAIQYNELLFNSKKIINDFRLLTKYKKDLLGYQIFVFKNYCYEKNIRFEKTYNEVFANPNFQDFSSKLISSLRDYLNEIISHPLFSDTNFLNETINKLVYALTDDFTPHPYSKALLDLYLIVNNYVFNSSKEQQINLSENQLILYTESFLNKIIYFKENNKNSKYYNDYLKILYIEDYNKCVKFIRNKNYTDLKNIYKKFINDDKHDIIINLFCSILQNESPYYVDIKIIYVFFTSHIIYTNEFNSSIIHKFFPIYFKLSDIDAQDKLIDTFDYFFENYIKSESYYCIIVEMLELSKSLLFVNDISNSQLTLIVSILKAYCLIVELKYFNNYKQNVIIDYCNYIETNYNGKYSRNIAITYNEIIRKLKLDRPQIVIESKKQKPKSENNLGYLKNLFD